MSDEKLSWELFAYDHAGRDVAGAVLRGREPLVEGTVRDVSVRVPITMPMKALRELVETVHMVLRKHQCEYVATITLEKKP